MRDKIETEGMIEKLVTVDQDQFQEQPQIGIGLDVLKCREYNPFHKRLSYNAGKQRGGQQI